MRPYQFALAYLLDLAIGDPRFIPHPVRGFGWAIRFLEKALRWPAKSPGWERFAGVILALGLPAAVFFLTYWLIYGLLITRPTIQSLVIILLAYTTLATRSLHQEAARVIESLQAGKVTEARKWLSWIVGRDTENLTREDMIKATLETMAENLSDGVIAPLFYLLIGGAPLALAFKAASTLDSMVGYKNDQYRHFGWASARLDDLWNYLPARITALLIVLVSRVGGFSWKQAWIIWQRDGRQYPSPNAGLPQAALAGALQVRLGGPALYGGVKCEKPFLGDDRTEISLVEYRQTVTVLYASSALMALVVLGGRFLWEYFKNSPPPPFF